MKFSIHKGAITSNMEDDYINLSIRDETSGIEFLELKMSFAEFGKFIGNNGYVVVDGKVRGLENVGKVYVSEPRTAEVPRETTYTHDHKETKEYIRKNHSEEGWQLDLHLGSQKSFHTKDGKNYANYRVFKYVDKE